MYITYYVQTNLYQLFTYKKREKIQYRSTYLHILQLHLSPFQAFMPLLNLNTFSELFIVSGMEFQRMLLRKAKEFVPKDANSK